MSLPFGANLKALEPICVFIEGDKMTSDTSACIRYVAHKTLAEQFCGGEYKLLFAH